MEREETAVRDLFARVDEVLDVAHSIEGELPREAARLIHVSHGALSSAGPVRVPIAARILLVSDKTVRAWVEDGLLTPRAVRPRLLLDAERLHAVLRFLASCARPAKTGTFATICGISCGMRHCWTGRIWRKAYLR